MTNSSSFSFPQKINIHGVDWELVKNANDPSVSFPFERVNTVDFDCAEISPNLYRILVTGNIYPSQGSLEKPMKLTFIGFSSTPIYLRFLQRDHLRKMSIYKADIGSFAKEFTNGFLGKAGETRNDYDITPYPTTNITEEGDEDDNG